MSRDRNVLKTDSFFVGNMVAIDARATNFSRLDFAQVHVHTPCVSMISKHQNIKINDRVCSIRMVEEMGDLQLYSCLHREERFMDPRCCSSVYRG